MNVWIPFVHTAEKVMDEDAGRFSVSFGVDRGAPGLASGVYFYRLETSSFVSTKKLILMK